MSGEPENLILVNLRRIDSKLDRVIDEVQDPKHRVTSLESTVPRLSRDIVGIRSDDAGLQARMDRIGRRLDVVESAR